MSHLFFSFIQPVVGTLVKFPNWHLFQSKSYFSIGNLWATIEISISTHISFKSTFNNIFSINHWLLKPWHFGKFHCWPCYVHQIMSHGWSNGKFPIFLFLFGSLAIKAMAFWEISPLALLCTPNYVSCMVKWEISNISLSVWHVGCQSHGILGNFTVFPPKSAVSQTCQNNFNNLIPPS